MASFSIQDLLGLGKDSRTNGRSNGSFKPPPAAKSKDAKPKQDPAADDCDIDVESLEEDSAQLVTVEVRTVHASSVSRSSSRKRKRPEEAAEESESSPDSDGKPP